MNENDITFFESSLIQTLQALNNPKSKLEDQIAKGKSLTDSFSSSPMNIFKKADIPDVGFDNVTLNWGLLMMLYSDSWVMRRAIDKPAGDIVRHGITIKGNKDYTAVYDYLNNLESSLIELTKWGALFGGSIGIVLAEGYDLKDLEKPFNPKKFKKGGVIRLYVTDRWYGIAPSSETVTELMDPDFGKPDFYNVTFDGSQTYKVHHSWVLRYEHRQAPMFMKSLLQGWGYSELAHVLTELSRDEKLKDSINELVEKSSLEIIKMSGMKGLYLGTDKNNEAQLKKRLESLLWARNYKSVTIMDKDDEYHRDTFGGLAGLADLLETNLYLVAGALEYPKVVLFGESKGGLSNNDLMALEMYNQTIQGRKNDLYRPILSKLLNILFQLLGIKEDRISFTFNHIITKTDDKRFGDFQTLVTSLSTLITDGVYTPQLAAKEIKRYANQSGVGEELTDDYIESLRDRVEEEMEEIESDLDKDEDEEDLSSLDKEEKKMIKKTLKDMGVDIKKIDLNDGWAEFVDWFNGLKVKYPFLTAFYWKDKFGRDASFYLHLKGRRRDEYNYSIGVYSTESHLKEHKMKHGSLKSMIVANPFTPNNIKASINQELVSRGLV